MAHFDRGAELQHAAALRAPVALVGTRGGRRTAARSRVPPRHRAGASRLGSPATNCPSQGVVGEDLAVDADRAERPAARAERLSDLVGRRRPEVARRARRELQLLEPVVAPDEASTRVPSPPTTGIAFEVAAASTEELGERLDRGHAGGLHVLRRVPLDPGTAGSRGTARAISRSAA